jgi:hypothetical protein
MVGRLFENDIHEDFGTWPLGYIPYGGADFGEVRAVAEGVGSGGDGAFYRAWVSAADRLKDEAEKSLAKGHRASARELYLRASVFYCASYDPLYGTSVDPRLLAAFRKQVGMLDKAFALGTAAIEPLLIPFEATPLPAYLIPAEGFENDVRPLIIFNNGYDATITDLYFQSAVAASRRGYHSLVFDGPGQGAMLYEHSTPMRPDWDVVIKAVVDFALTLPNVAADRIALSGASLGGHLAPRAASGEHRLAALIADPGTWSIASGFRAAFKRMFNLSNEDASDLGKLDQSIIDKAEAFIRSNPSLNWKVVKRGYWVHGVDNFRDFLAAAELFTLDGRAELIQCPTLIKTITWPATPNSCSTRCVAPRLCFGSPRRKVLPATAMGNRSLLNRRALDWLDEQFA